MLRPVEVSILVMSVEEPWIHGNITEVFIGLVCISLVLSTKSFLFINEGVGILTFQSLSICNTRKALGNLVTVL